MTEARPSLARALAPGWIAVVLALALLYAPADVVRKALTPIVPGMRAAEVRLARERLDSAMAWQRADSLRRVRGDSVVALAYTPPSRVGPRRTAAEERVGRWVIGGSIVLLAIWKSRVLVRESRESR